MKEYSAWDSELRIFNFSQTGEPRHRGQAGCRADSLGLDAEKNRRSLLPGMPGVRSLRTGAPSIGTSAGGPGGSRVEIEEGSGQWQLTRRADASRETTRAAARGNPPAGTTWLEFPAWGALPRGTLDVDIAALGGGVLLL